MASRKLLYTGILKPIMGYFSQHRFEIIVIRLLKALGLSAAFFAIDSNTSLFPSEEAGEVVLTAAIIIQLLLQLRLPSGMEIFHKNELVDKKRFFAIEFRFILLLIASTFFLNFEINPTKFALLLLANFGLQWIFFFIGIIYFRRFYKTPNSRAPSASERKAIIVGAARRGKETADLLMDHPELNIRIVGFIDPHREGFWRYRDIPLIGHPADIGNVITHNHIDLALMALEKEDFAEGQSIFDTLEKMGVNICLPPNIYDRAISQCRTASLNGQPALFYHVIPENMLAQLLKTAIDRIGALVGIILTFPIFWVSAVAIKINSGGPVLYKQLRCGKNGRLFPMLKLRTMNCGAEKLKASFAHLNEMSGPVFKIERDPRVTAVGRFLRKYSIDELPQLLNVLSGDMSLVGPRPPLPEEVEQYEPWQRRRLAVRPGITCLWQINGRNKIDFVEWMKLDLKYIDNWSLARDALILIKTIPTVLRGNGV